MRREAFYDPETLSSTPYESVRKVQSDWYPATDWDIPMHAKQPLTKWLLAVNRVGMAIPRWALFNWIKGLIFRTLFFGFSPHRTFDGINLYWVDISRLGFRKPGDGEEEAFFATVTKALTLLQAYDP